MRAAIMREAAGEIAGFKKVVDERIEHVVKSIFAMRPMAQEIFDIEPARLARCADKRRCHFRLMKGLIPDFIQAVGRAHACADPGINAIEEEQAGDTLRRFAGHGLHRRDRQSETYAAALALSAA